MRQGKRKKEREREQGKGQNERIRDKERQTETVYKGIYMYMCCTCVVMCINTSVFVVVVKHGAHKEEQVSCVIASGFLKWLGSPLPPTTKCDYITTLELAAHGKGGGQLDTTEVKGPQFNLYREQQTH